MALPTSGNLSLSQVRAEFGAPVATPLSAFLRGGAWVPDTAANVAVPTVLPISLRQLLGSSAIPPLSVTAPDIDAGSIAPDDAIGSSIAVVSGGIGPFSYAWSWVVGGTGITLSNAATATVTATKTTSGVSSGTARVTVTDAGDGGKTAAHDISITLEKSL